MKYIVNRILIVYDEFLEKFQAFIAGLTRFLKNARIKLWRRGYMTCLKVVTMKRS